MLHIDGIVSALFMLIVGYIGMFCTHKNNIQTWISSLSGIQIGIYLIISEMIRIMFFYILIRIIFLLVNIQSLIFMMVILGSTILTTLLRWFTLFKYRKEIKKEAQ